MVVAGCRGFSLVEVMVALAILAIVSSVAFEADRGQLRHVEDALAETRVSRLVASRLELLCADPSALRAGESQFALVAPQTLGLDLVRGVQQIRARSDGLFEVSVEVSWLPRGASSRRRVQLLTWVSP